MTAPPDSKKRPATYADIESLPEHVVGEIINGVLWTHPRPARRHIAAASSLGEELIGPYQKARGGPGGWIILDEPELHLGANIVVPDLAGWRRERLHGHPETAYFSVAPDWVCEVLSASTELRDRTFKKRLYAEVGVGFLWLIDPRLQLLEAFALRGGVWVEAGTWSSDDRVRAAPFDAITFSLADLWPFDPPLGLNEDPTPYYAGDR
jgi:Uma2 family endonuclease